MSKISCKYKKGKITVENRLTYPEAVNEQVYLRVSNGMFSNIMPVYKSEKHKDIVLYGTVEGYVPLKEYLGGIVSKRTFLKVVSEIIDIIKECSANMLNANNLDLVTDRVFIEPREIKILVLYWPVVNNQLATPVEGFFRELAELVELPEGESRVFLGEYYRFFTDPTPFSFNNFEKMIAGFTDKDQPQFYLKSENTAFFGNQEIFDDYNAESAEYDPFAGIEPEKNEEQLSIPVIVRENTGEIFVINSEEFVIGSGSQSNCRITGNSHISRRHASVVYEDGHFSLVDLSSTNGTFMGEKQLVPQIHEYLEVGASFKLADEMFSLQVRCENALL